MVSFAIIEGEVNLRGEDSAGNSTTTPLLAGATFTGTYANVSDFSCIVITVFADQASAAGGIKFDWSGDGTNIDRTDATNLGAGDGRAFSITPRSKFFRIRYVNGATPQGAFRIQVVLRRVGVGLITRPLGQDLDDNNFAQTVRAVLTGKSVDGMYRNIALDDNGRLIVADPATAGVAVGLTISRATLAATAIVDLAHTTYTEQTTNAQRSLVSTSANDAAAGTGARTMLVTYYDAALNGPFTEIITMNGTTAVNTAATNVCFIESMEVLTQGSATEPPAGTISLKAATGGGGATIWSIGIGAQRTLGLHHYVGVDAIAFITGVTAACEVGAAAGGAAITLWRYDVLTANSSLLLLSDFMRVVTSGNSLVRRFDTPLSVVGPSVIRGRCKPDTTTSRDYFASFSWYEQ